MNVRRQWVVTGGIVAVLVIAAAGTTRVLGNQVAPVEAGSQAPDFRAMPVILGAHGSNVTPKHIADYQGKVVLLNIWATWCDPCRSEMPNIEKLHEELGPSGLSVVAISIDQPGMEPAIREFAQQYGLKFEILHDAEGKIEIDYQTSGFPETFVIGKDGIIRKRVIGATDWDAEPQKALIRKLLSEPGA
jgi:thiol-disulfide isomerase/thioredoxin